MEPSSEERRREARRGEPRLAIQVAVTEIAGTVQYFHHSGNLSAGGIFLERTISHAHGTEVQLTFTLPNESTPLVVTAEVRRPAAGDEHLGQHLSFVGLTDSVRERIRVAIERAQEELGDVTSPVDRRGGEPSPAPTPESSSS